MECPNINDLWKEVETIKQEQKKMMKIIKKLKKEEVVEPKEKKANGFAKPMFMSKSLCDFLNVGYDHQMARTEVTKSINSYVKQHNLQNPENKRELILDDKLKTILNVPETEKVTFFNLQRYMKDHYTNTREVNDIVVESLDNVEPVPETPKTKVVKKVIKKKST